jgi:hypothetical protein
MNLGIVFIEKLAFPRVFVCAQKDKEVASQTFWILGGIFVFVGKIKSIYKWEILKQKAFFPSQFSFFSGFFSFYLVQIKLDVPSWPTYLPTMSHFSPIMLYLPTYLKKGRH